MDTGTNTIKTNTPEIKDIKKTKKSGSLLRLILLLVSYIVVGLLVWKFGVQMETDPAKLQEKAENEVKMVVKKVSALMLVPTIEEEVPQVATISDAQSLASAQAFFGQAQNGDQVIIYLKAQKAIIYRPSENKIINVGPIIAESDPNATANANRPAAQTPTTTSDEEDTEN